MYPALTRYSIKICWGVSTSQHRRHLREGITCICFPHTSTMAAGDEFRAWVGQVAYKPASYSTAHVNPQKKDKIIWKHEPRVTLSQDPHPPEAARGLAQSAQRHSLRFGSDTSKAGGFIPISFSPASMCSAGSSGLVMRDTRLQRRVPGMRLSGKRRENNVEKAVYPGPQTL